jgi:two-component system sensor histidine kinase CpxA
MFHGRLQTKIFLWLLAAMTVTAAAASGVAFLLFHGEFERRLEQLVLAEVGMGRDIMQNLIDSGRGPREVERLLVPVTHGETLSVAVVDEGGREIVLLDPAAGEARRTVPTQAEIRRTLERGASFGEVGRRRYAAGLPIRLASGEPGVFFVTLRGKPWWRKGPPYRSLISIAVVLVVGWLLSWPIARHLARPLGGMAATADALGKGDLSARIAIGRRHRRRRRDEMNTLAESFNAMADNLQNLVVGHKQLLGDISHELRSPLARLKVGLELARKEAGPGAAEYLDGVEAQANAVEGMIEELLTYSRLEAAPYELHRETFPPGEVLEEVAALLQGEREAREIALDLRAEGGPSTVSADRRLLVRALGNAVRNAIAYAPEGSTVAVGLQAEAGRLVFSVSDGGEGVPEEMLERIFQPFVRTDAARSRATGGVGLGLAIARRCMEAHGGGAEAAAGPEGRGLTLRLWLPVGEAGGDAEPRE